MPPVLPVVTVALLFFPQTANAQLVTEHDGVGAKKASHDYEHLLDRAVDAFDAKEYATARVLFEQAYVLRPNARILRGLGISALHLERFTIAKRELKEALRETKQSLTTSQREGVMELLSWMDLNLGTLQLQIEPEGARATLDDEPVIGTELVVKPGAHRLVVNAEGFIAQQHTVELAVGQVETLKVVLEPAKSPDAPSPAVAARQGQQPPPITKPAEPSSPTVVKSAEPSRDPRSSTVFGSWWFWTAVGVVVAGGVATTVAVSSSTPEKAYEKGGLGGKWNL